MKQLRFGLSRRSLWRRRIRYEALGLRLEWIEKFRSHTIPDRFSHVAPERWWGGLGHSLGHFSGACPLLRTIIHNSKGDLEEKRRLLYVGITRAMKELVVSYYRSSFGQDEEPSPFLADMLRSPSVIFCPVEDYKKRKTKA